MTRITTVVSSIILLFILGCQPAQQTSPTQAESPLNDYLDFAPVKIKIVSLTEFVDDSNLKIYIDLIDKFGSRVKSPAVFRFELYEYIERSAEPKGRRIFLWPDIDLTDTSANNKYWRDFLRSYEFTMDMDFDLENGRTYILQAFCRTSSGTRLTTEKQLTFTNR